MRRDEGSTVVVKDVDLAVGFAAVVVWTILVGFVVAVCRNEMEGFGAEVVVVCTISVDFVVVDSAPAFVVVAVSDEVLEYGKICHHESRQSRQG